MQSAQTVRVLLPGVNEARNVFSKLLASDIPRGNIHFLGKRNTLPEDLPPATLGQKTDLFRAAFLGMFLGGIIGLVLSATATVLPLGQFRFEPIAIPIFVIVGSLLGLWSSTLVGVSKPNPAIESLDADFEAGKVLMIVDVPPAELDKVRAELQQVPHTKYEQAPA